MGKNVIIIGAGPAGLTAALELLDTTDLTPIVFESDIQVGGIAKTINYKGNRIDIGGHRFFSKSDWVMEKWQEIMPLQDKADEKSGDLLVRSRLSRILYLRKYFDYPVSPSLKTFRNLGLARTCKIMFSYLRALICPIKPENNLEDFFINRFGVELYQTFFKDYTEKVWGLPCAEISASWGAQRIKGISVIKLVSHALKKIWPRSSSICQKDVETSLIEQFLYPKLGPGQLWEKVAEAVVARGGEILMNHEVQGLKIGEQGTVEGIVALNTKTGEKLELQAEHYLSSMPVKDLVNAAGEDVPQQVRAIAETLPYRDFITVGVLVRKTREPIPDNWIYIQEPDVKVGRLQIFNNWSPYLVADEKNVWIGMEYFCTEGDDFWSRSEADIKNFAVKELAKLNLIEESDVLDLVTIKVKKAYPAYFGSYSHFDQVREWLDTIPNLWPIGRNGMHRYNNMDHSMLTAKLAVAHIRDGIADKNAIWQINAEEAYHESK